jgi:hypothetical protein
MGFAMLVTGLSTIGTGILGEIFPIRIAIAIVAGISGIASFSYLIGSMGLRRRLRALSLTQPQSYTNSSNE